MKPIAFTALILGLAACAPDPVSAPQNAAPASVDNGSPSAPADSENIVGNAAAPVHAAASHILTLEGLGDLRIGAPVPAGNVWVSRGAPVSDGCTTLGDPSTPGVYAIVEDGKVRRITVGQRSDVKLIEGIGVGSTEKAVMAAFPGFRAEPHKYEDAPAKYLTAPNADRGDVALRFEIGGDGKVGLMHVGTMPVLGYVEGCA